MAGNRGFFNPNFDTSKDFWTKDNADAGQWNAGKVFLWDSGNDPDRIIFWSRIPIILLSLILGLFIFRWTRELAGTLAGLFALALYTFNPNILGHNHFVTTDIGIAAFIVFAFYYFSRFIKKPTWKNVFIFGLFLGLMQLAKFSSVLTFPIIFLVLIIYPLIKSNGQGKLQNLKEYLLKGYLSFLISIFYYSPPNISICSSPFAEKLAVVQPGMVINHAQIINLIGFEEQYYETRIIWAA
jgi:hypothetical protein